VKTHHVSDRDRGRKGQNERSDTAHAAMGRSPKARDEQVGEHGHERRNDEENVPEAVVQRRVVSNEGCGGPTAAARSTADSPRSQLDSGHKRPRSAIATTTPRAKSVASDIVTRNHRGR